VVDGGFIDLYLRVDNATLSIQEADKLRLDVESKGMEVVSLQEG